MSVCPALDTQSWDNYRHQMSQRNFTALQSALAIAGEGSSNRTAVLTAVLGAIGRNDFGALAQHFTADAQLHIHGSSFFDGSWTGREAVLGAIVANFDKIAEQRPELESMVQQGDSIVALVCERGVLKQETKQYTLRGIMWWTFDGDQITRLEEFVAPVD